LKLLSNAPSIAEPCRAKLKMLVTVVYNKNTHATKDRFLFLLLG
jgi:hypothetical protein